MGIGSVSAASLGQYVLEASGTNQLQQSLQNLQSSLASGDLNGAQAAFGVLQQVTQGLAEESGSDSSSDTQLSSDLTTLGSALSAGDLSTATTAFATVQSDLKSSNAPSETNELNAASQSAQLVNELLSSVNAITSSSTSGTSSGTADSTISVLERVYGNPGTLNVQA